MSQVHVIKSGIVVHASTTQRADVVVTDGVITDIATNVTAPTGATIIDAEDCWVGPGFVDLHTHLREPGREESETIESGSRAGALGGYSAILAMPNTEPAIDNVIAATYVIQRARDACIEVAVAGAITVERRGERLAQIAELAMLGIRFFTDDGTGVQDAALMRRALMYAKPLGVTLAQHCEDNSLAASGVMNEGALSSRLGLSGRPALAEELMVMRDIELVRLTRCSMHFLHLSTARSVQLVQAARAEGLPVTCEVAPHHLYFDESACGEFDATFKVHPPLRLASDVAALQQALRSGDIDAVATDHAPHASELKDLPFDEAPPGMLGLQHAASVTLGVLGVQSPNRFFEVMSRVPARIAQLTEVRTGVRSAHGGNVAVGESANLVIFHPDDSYVVDRAMLASRSSNSPYHGERLTGRTRSLMVRGEPVVLNGEFT